VVVTGGAGFIGSHVVDELLGAGHDVLALDGLLPQVHAAGWPADRAAAAQRLVADLRDADAVAAALRGADAVVHQAALVGHGLDLADLPDYAGANDLGTAQLLAQMHAAGVSVLVLASSMVVYGEGRYRCDSHGIVIPSLRHPADLSLGMFEPRCPQCREPLGWQPVPEDAPLRPTSVYAASKLAQENLVAAWARGMGVEVVALRYHNVYGPRMPRDSPYSGVAALFRSRVAAGQAPLVFEDGAQMRDFVHVSDVARANRLALQHTARREGGPAGLVPVNICSGMPRSVGWAARVIAEAAGAPPPEVTGQFRPADVRHVVARPDLASEVLGFVAEIEPEMGMRRFAVEPLAPGPEQHDG
jgi:dTDP-L-rhamnose 4-epimerase